MFPPITVFIMHPAVILSVCVCECVFAHTASAETEGDKID